MDDVDLSVLPDVIDAVLELMPTGPAWREVLADEPGLSMLPADPDGWMTVRHRDVDVMWLHLDCLTPGAGRARVMVDGRTVEVGVGTT